MSPKQSAPEQRIAIRHGNEELVWRRKTQTVDEVHEVEHRVGEFGPTLRPRTQATPIEKELAELKRVVETSVAQPVTKLDPSLVDHLADDVIRKVEKRVRIERERRGI